MKRIVDWGADAVKILIYYTPFDDAGINDIKHAFIERIGAECETYEIPFFLEFVGYDPKGGDEKGLEFAKVKPEIVTQEHGGVLQAAVQRGRAEGGSADQRRVRGRASVYKGQKAYTRDEALEHFREAAAVATKPFIYLSAGVSNAQFVESLQHGGRSRHGLLGRAVRPRHLEGRHPGLRQAGRQGAGRLAAEGRRETSTP